MNYHLKSHKISADYHLDSGILKRRLLVERPITRTLSHFRYGNRTFEDIIEKGGPLNWTFLQCEHFISLCQNVIPEPEVNFFTRVNYPGC